MKPTITLRHLVIKGRVHFGLEFDYNETLIHQCRRLQARWSSAHRLWNLPYSEANYRKLRVFFQEAVILRTAEFDRSHRNYLEQQKLKVNHKGGNLSTLCPFARKELRAVDRYLSMRRYSERTRKTFAGSFVFFSKPYCVNASERLHGDVSKH